MNNGLRIFCLALLSLLIGGVAGFAAERPNILMIMVDDLGWNHHSVKGANLDSARGHYLTPNLERLAASGLSFTHAYAQPNCAPTRAAMLTGQYPARIHNDVYVVGSLNRNGRKGISKQQAAFTGPEQSEDVAAEAITVAEALKKNGYVTAHIGKYHVGGHEGGEATLPEKAGFDINIGGGKAGHQSTCFARKVAGKWKFPKLAYGALDPFAAPYDEAYLEKHGIDSTMKGQPKHICDAMADALEQTLTELSAKQKPFYIQFHPYAVHGPVRARPDLKEKAAGRTKGRRRLAKYLGFIAGFDEAIGRALQRLEDPDGDGNKADSVLKDTVVLFASDNGGTHASNAPLRGKKGEFYEGGIRIPLIVSWPGVVPAGQVTDRMVHSVDFYPTYLDLAAAKWRPEPDKHPLDGESFIDVLKQPDKAEPRGPLFFFFPGYLDTRATPLVSVIDEIDGKRYKLIHFWEGGRRELYCLSDDVGETENLATKEPAIVKQLGGKIVEWLGQEHPTWKPKLPIDKKTGKAVGELEF